MKQTDETEKLVKKAVRGSTEAYGTLVGQYQEYLYKTAFLYTGNEADALDAVQECILKGFRAISTLKSPEYFRTWLTRILINAARDQMRRAAKTVPYEELWERPAQEVPREEYFDLHDAVRALPEKYRAVIILKYFNDLKIEEIAKLLEIPRGTVSVYLARARGMLRARLEEGEAYGQKG